MSIEPRIDVAHLPRRAARLARLQVEAAGRSADAVGHVALGQRAMRVAIGAAGAAAGRAAFAAGGHAVDAAVGGEVEARGAAAVVLAREARRRAAVGETGVARQAIGGEDEQAWGASAAASSSATTAKSGRELVTQAP